MIRTLILYILVLALLFCSGCFALGYALGSRAGNQQSVETEKKDGQEKEEAGIHDDVGAGGTSNESTPNALPRMRHPSSEEAIESPEG